MGKVRATLLKLSPPPLNVLLSAVSCLSPSHHRLREAFLATLICQGAGGAFPISAHSRLPAAVHIYSYPTLPSRLPRVVSSA